MKAQKLHLLLLLLFCNTMFGFAQENLRDMVCIVRPQFTEETKKFYSDYGRALSRDGFIRAGSMLMARGTGGFGSGVVIRHQNNYYVLTNQHVVSNVMFVTLEFRTSTGEERKFENSRVIASDRRFDLALIAFPQDADIQFGFVISDEISVREGMEVWSAGFPGLGRTPSWQLGNGIISNQSAIDTLITNEKLPFVIQHTAQMDAGSSGGALLVASPDEKSGYSLIGINTWKVRGRENVNFAIPMSAIKTFLANAQETAQIQNADRRKVETLTKQLLEARNAPNYKKILPLISENFIYSIPVATFNEMFSNASSLARADARTALRNVEPFEAFRIVIADAIYRNLRRQTPIFGSVKADSGDAGLTSTFTIRGREREMEWALEDDEWLLVSTSLLRITERRNSTNDWDNVDVAMYLGAGFSLDSREGNNYSLVMESWRSRYIAMFMEFFVGTNLYERRSGHWTDDGRVDEETWVKLDQPAHYFGLSYGLTFQYPLNFFAVQTIPFVKIPVGAYLGGSDGFGFSYGVRPGIRFAYQLNRNRFLFVDVEYRFNFFSGIGGFDSDAAFLTRSASMLGVNLGFTW